MTNQSVGSGKKDSHAEGKSVKWRLDPIALLSLVLALVALGLILKTDLAKGRAKKIAFVDTQRLLTGFKEAHKVNKEIEAEDGKWRKDLKTMEDSLKAHMDNMSANYDHADVKKKKEMQDELSVRNQQTNNFERVNVKRMQDLTNKKMAAVYEKINSLMKEYGKAKDYDIVFGTVNGSILYGEGTSADITDEFVELLNKRFE
jgi:Skp family chaperone for outer membrane proteins